MYCKNCGAKLDEGALFCRRCGTSAADGPDREPANPWGNAPEPKREPAAVRAISSDPEKQDRQWPSQRNPFGDMPQKTPKTERISRQKEQGWRVPFLKNRRLLLIVCLAALAAVAAVAVIISASSCKKQDRAASLEDVQNAVLAALEKGDGEALASEAKLSEPLLGAHPEEFGDGDTPEAVMRGYYDRLAGDFHARLTETYGDGYRLTPELLTEYYTDTQIFEENRALEIDGSQYAVLSGPLYVGSDRVATVRIVAVEWNAEWKLLVVDLY